LGAGFLGNLGRLGFARGIGPRNYVVGRELAALVHRTGGFLIARATAAGIERAPTDDCVAGARTVGILPVKDELPRTVRVVRIRRSCSKDRVCGIAALERMGGLRGVDVWRARLGVDGRAKANQIVG